MNPKNITDNEISKIIVEIDSYKDIDSVLEKDKFKDLYISMKISFLIKKKKLINYLKIILIKIAFLLNFDSLLKYEIYSKVVHIIYSFIDCTLNFNDCFIDLEDETSVAFIGYLFREKKHANVDLIVSLFLLKFNLFKSKLNNYNLEEISNAIEDSSFRLDKNSEKEIDIDIYLEKVIIIFGEELEKLKVEKIKKEKKKRKRKKKKKVNENIINNGEQMTEHPLVPIDDKIIEINSGDKDNSGKEKERNVTKIYNNDELICTSFEINNRTNIIQNNIDNNQNIVVDINNKDKITPNIEEV